MSDLQNTPQRGRHEVDVVIREAKAPPNSAAFIGAVRALSQTVFTGTEARKVARDALAALDAVPLSPQHRAVVWSNLATTSTDRIFRQDILLLMLRDPAEESETALSRLARMPLIRNALAELSTSLSYSLDIAVGDEHQQLERAHARLQALRIPVEPFGAKFEQDRLGKLQRALRSVERGETAELHTVVEIVFALLLHGSPRSDSALSGVVGPAGRAISSSAHRHQVLQELRSCLDAMVESAEVESDKDLYHSAARRLDQLISPQSIAPRERPSGREVLPPKPAKPTPRAVWAELLDATDTLASASAAFIKLADELGDSVNDDLALLLRRFRDQPSARELVYSVIRARPSLGRLEILTAAAGEGVPGVSDELIKLATGKLIPAPTHEVRTKARDAFWRVGQFEGVFRGPRQLCNLFEREVEQHGRGLFRDREHIQSFVRDHVLSWPNRREALHALMAFRWYRLLTPRGGAARISTVSPESRKLRVAFARARQAEAGPRYSTLEEPFGELISRMSPEEFPSLAPIENSDQLGTLCEVLRLYPPDAARSEAIYKLLEGAANDQQLARSLSLVTISASPTTQERIMEIHRAAGRWTEVALTAYCVSVTDVLDGSEPRSLRFLRTIPQDRQAAAITGMKLFYRSQSGSLLDRYLNDTIKALEALQSSHS